ncbi:BgTH12-06740, partial [Blumeria graminis f. sp. triticale]
KTIHRIDQSGDTISLWNIITSRERSGTARRIWNSIEITCVPRAPLKETSTVVPASDI